MDLIVQVLTLILLENKVLIQSRDLNALSLSVLALTHLLYPLQACRPRAQLTGHAGCLAWF